MKQGIRLYNLFPLLAGTTADWIAHLDRIRAMNFTAVYLNPVTRSGGSQSLYAVADYDALDPRFDDKSGRPGEAQLRAFLDAARERGLGVLMDLVVNHTANDAELVKEHPEWYRRDAEGKAEAPYAVDLDHPDDVSKRTVWGDLAELDYSERPEREEMIAYFGGVVKRALELGYTGFRCDAAYKVPGEVWRRIIDDAKRTGGDALFVAETLGAPMDEVLQLADAGFDAFFNSLKWWDFHAPWLLDQYDRLRGSAPSIAFPESHDTPRLATELGLGDAAEAERVYRMRYALCAAYSSGVMIPMGFEFGARKALNVVETTPADAEAPLFDISGFIAATNACKASQSALNEEGPQRLVDFGFAKPVGLERRTRDGHAPILTVFNPSNHDMRLDRVEIFEGNANEITPEGAPAGDDERSLFFPPMSLRIFGEAR